MQPTEPERRWIIYRLEGNMTYINSSRCESVRATYRAGYSSRQHCNGTQPASWALSRNNNHQHYLHDDENSNISILRIVSYTKLFFQGPICKLPWDRHKKRKTNTKCRHGARTHAHTHVRTHMNMNVTKSNAQHNSAHLRLHELVLLPVGADDVPSRGLELLGQVRAYETGASSDTNLKRKKAHEHAHKYSKEG